jgi:hypothetical protein
MASEPDPNPNPNPAGPAGPLRFDKAAGRSGHALGAGLAAMRGPGESYSDVILRRAKTSS